MDKEKAVLSLLFLAVIASGCTGGEESAHGSITINSLTVTPSEIFEGQQVRTSLDVSNTGSLPASIAVGEGGNNVLRDYCTDVFDSNSFSASTTAFSSLDESQQRNGVTLEPGHEMRMRWALENVGTVPLYGKRCTLKLAVPFNYSVSAFRQVQIKQNSRVEGSTNLQYDTTSGPLDVQIDTLPGSTGKPRTFISNSDGGNRNVTFLLKFVNSKPEQEYTKGLINIDRDSLAIETSDPLNINERAREDGEWRSEGYDSPKCEVPAEIEIFEGDSVIIRCTENLPETLDGPSEISEFSVNVNYTYVKDVSERTIEVKSRG